MTARVLLFAVLGGSALMAQGRGGMAPPPPPPYGMHDISGYWELGSDARSIPTADLTPAAKAAAQKVSDADAISMRWCRPLGMPALMDAGRPLDIRQGRWEIIMVPEANSSPRHVYTDRKEHVNPDIFDPTSVGDSVAHWEGDTLVVDTIGFHKSDGRLSIPGGGTRTEKSHLVERFKLIRNGSMLSVTSTWTDPDVFRTPHTYEFLYTRVVGRYEPRQIPACDPWDAERAEFVTRTFRPELKKAAEAALVKPGTPVKAKGAR